MNLITPVEYAKIINIAPQQVYGMIKRGLPTHQAEHKGKMRDLVDPAEADEWRAIYETMKRTRKTKEDTGEDEESDSPRDESEESRPKQTMFRGGELLVTARGSKNISVSRVMKPEDEHFAWLQRSMYTFPFLLSPTYDDEWFMNPQDLKRRILTKQIILDTPTQVMEYCLAQIEVARPEMAAEIRAVIQKHIAETEEIVAVAEKTSYNYHRR